MPFVSSVRSEFGITGRKFANRWLGNNPTGGNATYSSGGYKWHKFTGNGTFSPNGYGTVEYVVIGGGGSGGCDQGGGGGSGQTLNGSINVQPGNPYSITMGGSAATNFGSVQAARGNNGGAWSTRAGNSGNGYIGGTGVDGGGGGGGGATSNGNNNRGNGGGATSAYSSWATATSSGVSGSFAGGGGGGGRCSGGGGGGGGGAGAGGGGTGRSATANTGSGGGGGEWCNANYCGGSGAAGIVLVRYVI